MTTKWADGIDFRPTPDFCFAIFLAFVLHDLHHADQDMADRFVKDRFLREPLDAIQFPRRLWFTITQHERSGCKNRTVLIRSHPHGSIHAFTSVMSFRMTIEYDWDAYTCPASQR